MRPRVMPVEKDLASLERLIAKIDTPTLLEVWMTIDLTLRRRGLLLEEVGSLVRVSPIAEDAKRSS